MSSSTGVWATARGPTVQTATHSRERNPMSFEDRVFTEPRPRESRCLVEVCIFLTGVHWGSRDTRSLRNRVLAESRGTVSRKVAVSVVGFSFHEAYLAGSTGRCPKWD